MCVQGEPCVFTACPPLQADACCGLHHASTSRLRRAAPDGRTCSLKNAVRTLAAAARSLTSCSRSTAAVSSKCSLSLAEKESCAGCLSWWSSTARGATSCAAAAGHGREPSAAAGLSRSCSASWRAVSAVAALTRCSVPLL